MRVFPGGKKQAAEGPTPCEFCHEHYPCHGQGFSRLNCPRVEIMAFLSGEDVHTDGWDVAAVTFKTFSMLEVEYDEEETCPESDES